ncbi:Hypothetical protein EAG7_04120 [Klebsiella aerogenes]|nr:Hypothetical protein EAG7_04120 [Klebsiella aerogenes]CCG32617.1 hypothetical protein [Klebsiella aerogenes EA1509E]
MNQRWPADVNYKIIKNNKLKTIDDVDFVTSIHRVYVLRKK